jgi:hypothetical protein
VVFLKNQNALREIRWYVARKLLSHSPDAKSIFVQDFSEYDCLNTADTLGTTGCNPATVGIGTALVVGLDRMVSGMLSRIRAAPMIDQAISSTMVCDDKQKETANYHLIWSKPAAEVVQRLARHNCPNITSSLDLKRCPSYAIAGGGYGDVYRGYLRDGSIVAIKCPRQMHIQPDEEGCQKIKVGLN